MQTKKNIRGMMDGEIMFGIRERSGTVPRISHRMMKVDAID
jgi:hypothetical protein